MHSQMAALQIHGPNDIRHITCPVPTPHGDEALIRVTATGLCGTDVEIAHGTQPYYTTGRASYPVIPGHEWAGVIVTAPAGGGFAIGEQVVGECSLGCKTCPPCRRGAYHTCENLRETGILNKNGAFAQYLTAPVSALHKVPHSVPAHTAAMIEPCAVALNGLKRCGLTPGAPLTIHGDGPIGLLTLLMAQALNAGPITLVGATPHRLALAKTLGATPLTAQDTPNIPANPHAIEATGNPAAAAAAITALAPGGTVALLGLFGGKPLENLNLDNLVIGDKTITGVLGSPHVWPETIALITQGALDPAKILTHRLTHKDFTKALNLAETKQSIKTVLTPT